MKIMIVDANEKMREMIRSLIFPDYADTIMELGDGIEAVKAYSRFHPDYVLMDIEIGISACGTDMQGISVAERIYAHEASAKIIFLTDYYAPAFRRRAEKLHAAGFVAKENLMEIRDYLI